MLGLPVGGQGTCCQVHVALGAANPLADPFVVVVLHA